MSSEKEALIIEYQKSPSAKLKEQIVEQHKQLVNYIANKLAYNRNDVEDLAQVGIIGLLKSVDQFDPSREVKFSTFATSNIIGEIKHYLRDRSHIVKIPRRLHENYSKINQFIKSEYQNGGKYPTVKKISDALDLSEEQVLESLEAGQSFQVASLDSSLTSGNHSHDSTDFSLMDSLGVDAKDDHILNKETLYQAISELNEREKKIVYLRYYESLTQAEIAKRLNLSQMHISRLLSQALKNLKKNLGMMME